MAIDLATKTVAQLETLQHNYAQQHRQSDPQYVAITKALDQRKSGHFEIDRTVSFLRQRARLNQYVSYKDLSDHYRMSWSAARRPIVKHLDDISEFAHGQGWPLISAIVVNKENAASGKLEADALASFARTASRLGYDAASPETFLRSQQEQVFAWGKTEPTA